MKRMLCDFPNRANSCPIHCGSDIFRAEIQKALEKPHSKVLVVVDRNVQRLYGGTNLTDLLNKVPTFIVPPGERSKSEKMLLRILGWLPENKADRNSIVVAIGGGVVTDIAGFAASCYMRGIRYISVPTTLVGQVDAAIGGKTGINFKSVKNLVGAFYPPQVVISDQKFLETLPKHEVRDGLVEAMKIFVSFDKNLVDSYAPRILALSQLRDIGDLIEDAVALKVRVVNADPYEKGLRQALNLGHTTGHAVEILNHWSHGKSVAFGILVAVTLARRHCGLPQREAEKVWRVMTAIYSKFDLGSTTPESLWARIQYDKKKSGMAINFVLLKKSGKHQIKSLNYSEFKRGFEETAEILNR